MESGTIVKWLKSEGERVEKGEPLYELDTDKVTQEVEADASGVLLRIAVQEGEVPVGRTIAVIGEEGEDVPASMNGGEEPPPKSAESDVQTVEAPAQEPEPEAPAEREVSVQSDGGRVKASPLARRIARERGIDLSSVAGTGPEGRIVAEDVERAEVGAAPPSRPCRCSGPGRRGRAPRADERPQDHRAPLTEAWQIPVFQLQTSVDMTRANALVERLRDGGTKATVTDVLTRVCADALMRHREVNAQWTDDAILLFPTANIGIAVRRRKGSSCRSSTVPSACGSRRSPPRAPTWWGGRARASSRARTSRTAPSRSRTSACSGSSGSRRC
jgi:pyruvate dehydrogenase E2 component (dihydrolipoamide acetyltransferase)